MSREDPVAPVVQKNIRTLLHVRRDQEERKGAVLKISEAVTAFAGSMAFVIIHAVILLFWLLINTRVLPILKPFDPYPFVMLAMAASVEAIFLSTFVLISQNRMAELAERRAELDLQVGLLTEHEVTRMLQMLDKLCKQQGVEADWDDLEELKREVAPETVLSAIEKETKQIIEGPDNP